MWKGDDDSGVPHALLYISVLVAFVWAVATLVAVVLPSHPVPPSLNAVMGGTVTALFSLVGLIGMRGRNGGGSRPERRELESPHETHETKGE